MKYFIMIMVFTLISCSHNTSRSNSVVTGSELIGGPFEMKNYNGVTVNEKTFHGRYQLIFFGFTNCGTVCPLGLSTMGRSLHKLSPAEQQMIQPLFITVDPKRDTNQVLKKYLKSFDRRLIGLRGSKEQVDQVVKKFRGYYGRIEGEDGDYSFDHSDIIYFMGKKGEYLAHFSSSTNNISITERISRIINERD